MAHASLWTLWDSGLAWGRLPVFIAPNVLGKPGYCALNLLHRLTARPLPLPAREMLETGVEGWDRVGICEGFRACAA